MSRPDAPVTTSDTDASAAPARATRTGAKLLPGDAREHNRALLLQTLFHGGPSSRADLARETGLTRVTVSDLVAGLIHDGYVVEKGVRAGSRPGKPAILIDIDRAAHRIVGIDLSAPGAFSGAVMTLDGDIVHRDTEPQPEGDVVPAVLALAGRLVEASHAPVLGIGVGTPGIVDDEGVVLSAPNLHWHSLDLRGLLERALDLPVLVANDANAAALAEYTLSGAGPDLMLVSVGAGVGAGLLSGGMPTRGARYAAGEIGHVTIGTDGGPACVCGKVGCLEAWLSVPALSARLDAAGAGGRDGILRDAGERLGIAVAPIVGALDLSEIVVSGPSDLIDGPLLDAAIETLRARTLAPFHGGVRVRTSDHGDDIVLRGAAVMVLSGRLGVS